MDIHDDRLRSTEDEPVPLIPHPDGLELSDEEIRRLQEILNSAGGDQVTFIQAKYRGLELLGLTLMLLDPKRYEHHLRHPLLPPGAPLPPPPPSPPPTPRPFPIKLDADHPREIEQALKMLAHELRYVKRKPTYWRWALVALYDAFGHTLALHRPASFLAYTGLGQLTKLFDAVAVEHSDIRAWREAGEEIDRLRTTWITRAVSEWPIRTQQLSTLFNDGISVIERLSTGRASELIGDIVSSLDKNKRLR